MPLTLHCSTFVEQEQLRLSISVLLALAYRVALNFAVLIFAIFAAIFTIRST